MAEITGRTPVRKAHAGLVLPHAPEFFEAERRYPVDDLRRWFDNVISVNIHWFGRRAYSNPHTLKFPSTTKLGIAGIERTDSNPVKRQLLGTVTALTIEQPVVLSVYDRKWDDKKVIEYKGEQVYAGTPYGQNKGQAVVQRVMQEVLDDLGYGTPEQFEGAALPLDEFRAAHEIVWPPAPHPLERYIVQDQRMDG